MNFSNSEVAKKLREIAATYTLKKGSSTSSGQANIFQIKAYETAADVIEKSASEIKDLWEEGKLDDVPGIGENLKAHLEELFKTGKVKHWEEVKRDIPKEIFEFLNIPGIGPKTALNLSKLGARSNLDLERKLKSGSLVKKGFSEKLAAKILSGTAEQSRVKSGRMLLPYAFVQAQKGFGISKKRLEHPKADTLGSLRRMAATVGDLDFAVASKKPAEAIEYIIQMPGISKVAEKGERQATIILASGLSLDFIVVDPEMYGALLQHFTGSKSHNIHLRKLALDKGLSLSEYGIKKKLGSGKWEVETYVSEEKFYKALGLDWIPPELREDSGEIEASLEKRLPHLIELANIKGDLHVHSNYPIEPSHDLGADSIEEIIKKAKKLGYLYIGIADHQPSVSRHTKEQIVKILEKRSKLIEHINYSNSNIRVLNLLEVDILPDGSLVVPEEGLKLLDFAIAGIHSVHRQSREQTTKRLLKALENHYVKILSHPTGRLLNQRESCDVDWPAVFKFAAKNNKALEINAFPDRLDLPDVLIREAKSYGVKFVINTDSHQVDQMENMRFGLATARRGWATKEDIVNCWDWTDFAKWFKLTIQLSS